MAERESDVCPVCGLTANCSVQYAYDHPENYDGVSEWHCRNGHRWGRWSGLVLGPGDHERRFGRPAPSSDKKEEEGA